MKREIISFVFHAFYEGINQCRKTYTSLWKELPVFCKARYLQNFNTTDIHVQLNNPLLNEVYVDICKVKNVTTVGHKK